MVSGQRERAARQSSDQAPELPPLGQGGRASPLVTKTMVFLGEGGNDGVAGLPPGGGGKMFRAYDKASGKVLWEMELPAGTNRRTDHIHGQR